MYTLFTSNLNCTGHCTCTLILMGMIQLKHSDTIALTDQIADQIQSLILRKKLRPGHRMLSIRRFAREHGISSFTVIAAYDRLVARGFLCSRRGSGFFVVDRGMASAILEHPTRLDKALNSLKSMGTMQGQKLAFAVPHLMAKIAGNRSSMEISQTNTQNHKVQPSSWLDPRIVEQSMRTVARNSSGQLANYGEPYGYKQLRETLLTRLAETGVQASLHGILTTHGASHAFDLVARYFIRPGDVVLVDDPGYLILFRHLELLGAQLVGIPRTAEGPDANFLETALKKYKSKIFFTNSVAQNPTGSSITLARAHQILRLAEKYKITIVEDDAYGDLVSGPAVRLAALDQLQHVIYIGSFSKTISCNIRVGFIACHQGLAEELVDLKILTGLTTCETNERIIHEILRTGGYRKHIDKLHRLLQLKRDHTMRNLESCGLELFCVPSGGMFLWARSRRIDDSNNIAELAADEGISLVPGSLFRPHHQTSPWLRFNTAFCDNPVIFTVIKTILDKTKPH